MGTHLRAADSTALLDVVEDLGRAADSDDLMRRTLLHLERLIPSDSYSFNWFAPGRISYRIHPEITPEVRERFAPVMAAHWAENPLVEHFRRTADTRALTWRDVTVDDRWREGTLYREFFLPMGVSDQLAVRLPSPPHVVAGLVCNRDGPFDRRDGDLLTVLGRHVVVQTAVVAERGAMRAVFDHRGWRTLQVDDDGRLVDEVDDDLRTVVLDPAGDLRPELADLLAERRALAATTRLPVGDAREVELPGGRVTAFLAPGPIPPHLLFVHPVTERSRPRSDALQASGLSPRESAVAVQLIHGATNRQIAADLGITVGTVKKHLARVFEALDVDNRAAAAGTVVRILG